MKINVTFTEELTCFYAGFQENSETFDVEFDEALVRYNGDLAEYAGPYSVTPKTGLQTLETAQKALMENIKVFAIPYAEVSNNSGGITATIGG